MLEIRSDAATGHQVHHSRLLGDGFAGIRHHLRKETVGRGFRDGTVKLAVQQHPGMRPLLGFHAATEIEQDLQLRIRAPQGRPTCRRDFDERARFNEIARGISAVIQFRGWRQRHDVGAAAGARLRQAQRLERSQCLTDDRTADAIARCEMGFRGQARADPKLARRDGGTDIFEDRFCGVLAVDRLRVCKPIRQSAHINILHILDMSAPLRQRDGPNGKGRLPLSLLSRPSYHYPACRNNEG
ncbi:Hypothetical protein AT6N2_L1478 [Agrobacterium tumefaciens]|nr:Hypothetical protein AT6N2_L1478 [Agrobacterium tumefaciens]